MLSDKKIILGVTGGIAAYKAALLVRLLVKEGAEVQVVMTVSASEFITPTTLATLSKRPVINSFYSNKSQGQWHNHVDIGLWADIMLIAPATAKTISSMANGYCNNVLQAIYLSARCPVMFAPAMDLDMYQHPATQQNIAKLLAFGHKMIAPESGELASGLSGKGRLAEPDSIVNELKKFFTSKQSLKGKKVLISAGPTYEKIDPVRYIGNHSSGKMGCALAEEAKRRGAEVTLVCGPSSISTSDNIKRIDVVSAQEMFEAVTAHYSQCDIAIMSAAVSDYTPTEMASQKIKKSASSRTITLKPTKDILKYLGEQKKKQFLVGFALETENELENAKEKRIRKKADLLVMNSLQESGAGFGHDTNAVHLIDKNNKVQSSGLISKAEAAEYIWNAIDETIN